MAACLIYWLQSYQSKPGIVFSAYTQLIWLDKSVYRNRDTLSFVTSTRINFIL